MNSEEEENNVEETKDASNVDLDMGSERESVIEVQKME